MTLWPLLPDEIGYWPNERNVDPFSAFVQEILDQVRTDGLRLPWIAVDMEPPIYQMDALRGTRGIDRLRTLAGEDLFRVVLLHHPPIPGTTSRRKGLIDAAAFREVIATTGAELVLYGHDHRFASGEIPGNGGPVPVFGVPSASALPSHGKAAAQYHLFGIGRTGSGWTVAVRTRRFEPQSGSFRAAESWTVDVSR